MNTSSNSAVKFPCGLTMKNRFMLAPMTNKQSHEDGQISEDELHWLAMRAKGEFGIVMTCASHVQEIGKGFSGQLGIFSDKHIEGHKRLTKNLRSFGSLSIIQLHHAGMRSPEDLIGQQPVCPSNNENLNARALSLDEVIQLKRDFIDAAIRSKKSGYDGVEVHGAHGYIITQFLSKEINKRNDQYGGTLENRSRLLFEIVKGIRESCGANFIIGVRLSPEKNGMDIREIQQISKQLANEKMIDFLDISLWDCFKQAEEKKYQNIPLLEHFTSLNLNEVMLTVAGNIRSGNDVHKILDSGIDFVTIGRSAILHHDFPLRVIDDQDFTPIETPVSEEHLINEGLSKTFITYMTRWPGFVQKDS